MTRLRIIFGFLPFLLASCLRIPVDTGKQVVKDMEGTVIATVEADNPPPLPPEVYGWMTPLSRLLGAPPGAVETLLAILGVSGGAAAAEQNRRTRRRVAGEDIRRTNGELEAAKTEEDRRRIVAEAKQRQRRLGIKSAVETQLRAQEDGP